MEENNKTMENQENQNRKRRDIWKISTFILIAIILVLGFLSFSGNITGNFILGNSKNTISSEDAGGKLLDYYIQQGAEGLSIDSIEEVSGVYQVNFVYQGSIVPTFITKDGEFGGQLSSLSLNPFEENQQQPQEVPKSDKPSLELFVMTHCPYGTQAEKGFIPFMESAIKNKVDAKIRFVHYTMHGEEEDKETLRQVCIREEQEDKYLSYLREFLVAGNSQDASKKAGIDENKINTCISNGKAEEYYAKDSELSQQYGVQGSPTLIVNGVEYSSGRSADAYLQTACSAFNTAPSECETLVLSSSTPNTMWGWDDSVAATDAQC